MSRVPIRLRLTAAFAAAMAIVVAAAGLFVYLSVRAELDDSVNAALESRAATVVAPAEAEEGFALLGANRGLTAAEFQRAARERIVVERRVPGIEGTARVLARPTEGGVVVVGQSLEDRDETLAGLVGAFAIGGPIAVVLASMIGYLLAAAGLAPVEAMRRRAAEVSLERKGEPLPLPAAHDEIRRLGETLNAMLDRGREAYERERRFVADASHELRTPLAVIKTELEGALRAGGHDPEVEQGLTAALEECDRLARLSEDLLVLARAGDGRLRVRARDLDARELLERARDRFAHGGRPIRIDAPDGLRLDADELLLLHALSNLVDNALRYGDGDVVLRGRPAQLEVADSGAGFPPGLRAFDRFTRGDAARRRDGTGLGLAIVRTIAEGHGGSAEILPGPGATVRITLPQAHLSGPS